MTENLERVLAIVLLGLMFAVDSLDIRNSGRRRRK